MTLCRPLQDTATVPKRLFGGEDCCLSQGENDGKVTSDSRTKSVNIIVTTA
jgi:hypothetical protein